MNVFTYGSLMFPEVWQTVVTGKYAHEKGVLPGYRRVFIQNNGYPVLRPSPFSDGFEGVIYFDVSHKDLALLDAFEGEYYCRKTVLIGGYNGATNNPVWRAQVYTLTSKYQHLASRREWTPEQFSALHKTKFLRTYCQRKWR